MNARLSMLILGVMLVMPGLHGQVSTGGTLPFGLTFDPSGKFAYVLNIGSNSLSAFAIDASTGALTPVAPPVSTGIGPRAITVDPSGTFVYVVNSGSNSIYAYSSGSESISVFRINPTSGALTGVAGSVVTGTGPLYLRMHPSREFAYVVDAGSKNISAFVIDAGTGNLTRVGVPVTFRSGPSGLKVDPSGKFGYVVTPESKSIFAFTIDPNTGALTAVGSPVATGNGPGSLVMHPSGRFAYVANFESGNASAFAIDPNTGALTAVGSRIAVGGAPFYIAMDPKGRFAYVANGSATYVSTLAIDGSTGALKGAGSRQFNRVGDFSVTVEPSGRFAAAARRAGSTAEELHALDYRMYAYLQTAQDRAAQGLLTGLPEVAGRFDPAAVGSAAPGSAGVFALAAIPARWALERRAWSEAARLEPRASAFPYTEAMTYFARALGAARTGDPATARAGIAALQQIKERLAQANEGYWAAQTEIQRRGAAAWLALAEKQPDEALAMMRAAAEMEDGTEKSAVTPGPIAPARELLGEMLMELNRPAEALKEFQATLKREPERFGTLYGAARAASLSGDSAAARAYYTQLANLCERGDSPGRPELEEARKAVRP